MSRSYNNRKGCHGWRTWNDKWDFQHVEHLKHSKHNRNRSIIKFDGTLYKHKKQRRNRNQGHVRTRLIWTENKISRWIYFRENVKKKAQFRRNWHYYAYVIPSIFSYERWAWLKGKSNTKGQRKCGY